MILGLLAAAAAAACLAPAPKSATWWPHEPAGFVAILDQPWTTDIPPQSGGLPGNHVLVTDQFAAPISAPSAIDFWWPAGLAGGNQEGGKYWFLFPAARIQKEVFVAFTFKLDSVFQGHNSGVQKLVYLKAHGVGNEFWLEVGGSGSGPLRIRVVTEFVGLASEQFAPNVTNYRSTRVAGENDVVITRGVWHRYEVYLKLPTVSGGAGTVKVWVDGTLALNRDPRLPVDRIMPMTFAGYGWAELDVDPIWGGVGDVKAHRDDLWFDHLYISAP